MRKRKKHQEIIVLKTKLVLLKLSNVRQVLPNECASNWYEVGCVTLYGTNSNSAMDLVYYFLSVAFCYVFKGNRACVFLCK